MNAATIERRWRRHTPAERLARFAIWLTCVAALVWSVRNVEIIPE